MATEYQQGESVVAEIEIRNKAGVLSDPGTSIKITIDDSAGAEKVAAQAMTKDSTGKYHYNYDLAGDAATGTWNVEVFADNTLVTIEADTFTVIAQTT